MTRRFKSIILLCVVILQTTLLPHFTFLSVIPNYVFVIASAMCLIDDGAESIVFCTAAGFVLDLLTGSPIGLSTILYLYISACVVIAAGSLFSKNIKTVMFICFAASFVYETMFGVFSSLIRNTVFLPVMLVKIVLPVSFINAILIIPVYFVLSRVKFEKKRKGIKYERQI